MGRRERGGCKNRTAPEKKVESRVDHSTHAFCSLTSRPSRWADSLGASILMWTWVLGLKWCWYIGGMVKGQEPEKGTEVRVRIRIRVSGPSAAATSVFSGRYSWGLAR